MLELLPPNHLIVFIVTNYSLSLHSRCYKEPNKLKYFNIRNNCGNSGDNIAGGNIKLYHKGCCHGDQRQTDDYFSPMTIAINKTVEGRIKNKKTQQVKTRSESKSQIEKAYKTAMREEAKYGKLSHFDVSILHAVNLL